MSNSFWIGFVVTIIILGIVGTMLMLWWILAGGLMAQTIFLRKKMNTLTTEIEQLSICKSKRMSDKIWNQLEEVMLCMGLTLLFWLVGLVFIKDAERAKWLFKLCNGIFLVAIAPIIMNFVRENKKAGFWNFALMGVSICIGGFTKTIEEGRIMEEEIGMGFVALLSMLMAIWFICLKYSFMKDKKDEKFLKNKIYTDLFMRTPQLDMENKSFSELVRMCEKGYYEFELTKQKMEKVLSIHFSNIFCENKEDWFKCTARNMKNFVIINVFCMPVFINFKDIFGVYLVWIIVAMIVFCGNICYLMKKDRDFLIRSAIRFFYSEWGYTLQLEDKKGHKHSKFVGRVQLFERGKHHNFMHKFLDIVALCRAVAFDDKANETKRIQRVSDNMHELSLMYNTGGRTVSYIDLLPVWVASLFEYEVTGGLHSNSIKEALRKTCIGTRKRKEVRKFLIGLWLDITRNKNQNEIESYINSFLQTIGS